MKYLEEWVDSSSYHSKGREINTSGSFPFCRLAQAGFSPFARYSDFTCDVLIWIIVVYYVQWQRRVEVAVSGTDFFFFALAIISRSYATMLKRTHRIEHLLIDVIKI